MKISAISPTNYRYNCNCTKINSCVHNRPVFKGYFGETAGSAAGMLLGVAATFVTGPFAALAIAGLGCVGGGLLGGKIEDAMDKN